MKVEVFDGISQTHRMLLSIILVGQAVWPDRLIATAIVVDPPNVPFALRVYMSLMGVGAFGAFCVDVFKWLSFRKQPAVAPIQSESAEVA